MQKINPLAGFLAFCCIGFGVLCFFRMLDPDLFVFWENSIFLPSPMFGAALNFRQNIICFLKV